MNGQLSKAAAAYVFGCTQPAWPLEHVLAYKVLGGLWYATTRWSPDGVLLLATGVDTEGRQALRIETLDRSTARRPAASATTA